MYQKKKKKKLGYKNALKYLYLFHTFSALHGYLQNQKKCFSRVELQNRNKTLIIKLN